jgi:thimet oligopeptidase
MKTLSWTALFATTMLALPALAIPAQANAVRDIMGSLIVDPGTPEVLGAKCESYIAAVNQRKNALETASGPATVENTLVQFDEATGLLGAGGGEFTLYQQTLLQPELRDAGGDCAARLSSLGSELSLSRPTFDRLSAIDMATLDDVERAYLADVLAGFERAGVALDEAGRARAQAINDELAQLSIQFARNIAEGVRSIEVRPEELVGLPQDYIDARPPGPDGTITLTTATTDYQPVMSYAASNDLRRRFSEVYAQRAWPQNDEVLRQILTLRAELAQMLGRANYAELALEDKMLRTPERVQQLMAETYAAARPAAERDYALNLGVLQQIEPDAERIEFWQSGYVSTRAQQELFDYNPQEARQYFAYTDVRDGVLELVEDLFDVEIRQWDTAVWHPDVEPYEMLDNGEVIGRFYFDNHPRPGKYTHANMIPIYPGIPGEDVPVGALVQNLPKGDHSTGLMEHGQVTTLLHEFGHMIHGMFSGQQRFFGQNFLNIEWDVIEAPSQMLENWVYDYDTLANFAVDARGNTIPRELVEKMNRVRYFNRGLTELRQLGLSQISLGFHTDPVPADMGAGTRAWRNQYDLIPAPDYDQMQAAFGHLDGYAAFYYTYLWSRVVGADLFTRFEAEGLRNTQTANAYREAILAPGASRPAEDMIRDFLGRDVTIDAFRADVQSGGE